MQKLTGVVEFTAVVRRREERDQLALGEELVAVLDDLVRTANQVEFMFPQEFRYDLQVGQGDDGPTMSKSFIPINNNNKQRQGRAAVTCPRGSAGIDAEFHVTDV